MRTLKVNLGDRSYPIYIGSDVSLNNELYSKHISSKKIALITNEQIADLAVDKIAGISDQAPPHVRQQAKLFKPTVEFSHH